MIKQKEEIHLLKIHPAWHSRRMCSDCKSICFVHSVFGPVVDKDYKICDSCANELIQAGVATY